MLKGIKTFMNKTVFLYDCIRSPFDIAQIIQMREKTDIEVVTSRASLPYNHQKVLQKCSIKKNIKEIKNYNNLEELLNLYKNNDYVLIGTSPASTTSLFDLNLKGKNVVFVYGNESSGLPNNVQKMMDQMIILPMNDENLSFMTLPVVTGAIAAEVYREKIDDRTLTKLEASNTSIDIVFSGPISFYDICLMLQCVLAVDFRSINLYSIDSKLDYNSNKVKFKVLSWKTKKIPTIQKIESFDGLIKKWKDQNKYIVGTTLVGDNSCHYESLFKSELRDKNLALIVGEIPERIKKQINLLLPLPLDDNKALPVNFASILFEIFRQKNYIVQEKYDG